MNSPPDDRSPLAVGYGLAMQIMTVSAEMVLPGLAGYWVDNQLENPSIVFTLIGFAIGMPLALWHLLKLTKANQTDNRKNGDPKDGTLS